MLKNSFEIDYTDADKRWVRSCKTKRKKKQV